MNNHVGLAPAPLCAKPSEMANAYGSRPQNHPRRSNRGQFRLDGSQTGGAFTMFEFRVPVAARVPVPHSHESFDETLFGLDGVTTWTVSGESVTVGPGDVLFIPRRTVHGFDNRGTALARGQCHHTGAAWPCFLAERKIQGTLSISALINNLSEMRIGDHALGPDRCFSICALNRQWIIDE